MTSGCHAVEALFGGKRSIQVTIAASARARSSAVPAAVRLRSQPKPKSARDHASLGAVTSKMEPVPMEATAPPRPSWPWASSSAKLGSAVRSS